MVGGGGWRDVDARCLVESQDDVVGSVRSTRRRGACGSTSWNAFLGTFVQVKKEARTSCCCDEGRMRKKMDGSVL